MVYHLQTRDLAGDVAGVFRIDEDSLSCWRYDERAEDWVEKDHLYLSCTEGVDFEPIPEDAVPGAIDATIKSHRARREWSHSVKEGSGDSGNYAHRGIPGEVGGSAPPRKPTGAVVRLSNHAYQRMKERRKYQSVKEGMNQLKGMDVPDGDWHMTLSFKGHVDAYLVGVDRTVKTVLGSWYSKSKLRGPDLAEKVSEADEEDRRLDIPGSIDNLFASLTDARAVLLCDVFGVKPCSASALAAGWDDWTFEGLTVLLTALVETDEE